MLRACLSKARVDRWPIAVKTRKGYEVAWNLGQLLGTVESLLTYCEEHDYTAVVKSSGKMGERFLHGLIRGEYSPNSMDGATGLWGNLVQ